MPPRALWQRRLTKVAKRIAAATTNKTRRKKGETKSSCNGFSRADLAVALLWTPATTQGMEESAWTH